MENNFKVDTLVKTFKDLQQEKSCLEQKLRELREQRKRIDSENETAFARLTQVGSRVGASQEVVAEENRPHAHALVPESLASPPYKQPKK